jgi:hypothetical protein
VGNCQVLPARDVYDMGLNGRSVLDSGTAGAGLENIVESVALAGTGLESMDDGTSRGIPTAIQSSGFRLDMCSFSRASRDGAVEN